MENIELNKELKKKLQNLIDDEYATDDEWEFCGAFEMSFKDTTWQFYNKHKKRYYLIKQSELNNN